MFSVDFSKYAQKQLYKLEGNLKERIINTLERIKIRPYSFVKKIVGSPYFRLRVGDYRIILDIQNNILIIHVLEVGHRKNIYK